MSTPELHGADSSTYANIFTFMGRPLSRDLDTADAVVMGIPYDMATSARSGAGGTWARSGPAASLPTWTGPAAGRK